jgi:hypothetical protein
MASAGAMTMELRIIATHHRSQTRTGAAGKKAPTSACMFG